MLLAVRGDQLAVIWLCLLALLALGQDASSLHRWGQAVAYIPSPPSILLHGGKHNSGDGFIYSSAPNSADTLLLPLTSSFSASTSSVITVDAPDSPAYAWHTLTPFSSSDGKWDLLSFGGDAPSEAVQTGSDSAWYLSLDPTAHTGVWQRQASGWGNQPTRRIYHSAVGGGGKVYLTGGLRNDGSGRAHDETYVFDPASGFTSLSPLPRATYHHASALLPNGTLVVLGGVAIDMNTGMPATRPLDTIAVLDTRESSATWIEKSVSGPAPQGRRGMASALSDDGKTLFIHGGASTTFSQVYNDAWTLDLETLMWTQVGQTVMRRQSTRQANGDPGGRYDHAGVMGSGGQIIILGGYGGDSVADPGPYVFNLPDGSWESEYIPAPAAGNPASDAAPSGANPSSPAAIDASQGQSVPASTPVDPSANRQISPTPLGENQVGEDETDGPVSGTNTAVTPSASSSDAPAAETSSMGLPAQLGLIFGILAVAGLMVTLLIWRYRRRKRQERLNMAIYGYAPAQPPSRPYGARDKGGEGLMEEARETDEKAMPPVPGPSPPPKAGFGTISASFASLRNFVQKPTESYAVLNDEGAASPTRKPTRNVGQGIRLIGPRSPRADPYDPYAEDRPRNSITTLDARRDMLSDEDSRNFPPGTADWEVGDTSRGRWRSAQSILASHAEDPFEDDEVDDGESLFLPPVIRGGPVPTPQESTTNLDPFDEVHARDLSDGTGDFGLPRVHSDPLLDLDALLPPPTSSMHKRFSGISMISGPSTAMSDREEGVIQQAVYASPGRSASASVVSPAETSYVPIKRTDTFFRRMAAGGISSLLSSSSKSLARSQSSSTLLYDIRDPAPPPSLWPVVSRDIRPQLQDIEGSRSIDGAVVKPPNAATTTKPPTAWKGGDLSLDMNKLQRPTHHPGPSLTSITSAKSMRDMVIVQREPTSSSGESAIIEHTPLGSESGHHRQESDLDTDDSEHGGEHTPKQRHGAVYSVPGSVVFDGAEFAMSPSTYDSPSAAAFVPTRSITPPSPPQAMAETPPRSEQPSRDVMVTPPKARSRPSSQVQLPSGSPIPHPLLSHRRPVSEMVNSINRRGAASASTASSATASPASRSLFSPASQYSPGSPARNGSVSVTSTPPRGGTKRPSTLYEAVKRDKLLVANPDASRK